LNNFDAEKSNETPLKEKILNPCIVSDEKNQQK